MLGIAGTDEEIRCHAPALQQLFFAYIPPKSGMGAL